MRAASLIVAAIVSLSAPVRAATVSLTLAREVKADRASLLLRRIDAVEDLRRPASDVREVDLRNAMPVLELEPGHWSVTVEGDGIWHAPQYFTVTKDARVALDVWPRATLTGTVATAGPRPAELSVGFRTPAGGSPEGDAACPIDAVGRFVCHLPATLLDIRLRARGHIAHYFWETQLTAGQNRDVGALKLRPGQSITGRIELPRELRGEESKVIVRAEPSGSVDGERPMIRGGAMLPITGKVERNGFFSIDGVSVGPWIVRARHRKKLHSEPITVFVIPDAEAHISKSLALLPPRAVELNILPPLDPTGKQWVVELAREIRRGHLQSMTRNDVASDGRWASKSLAPGSYRVSVLANNGDEWHYEEVLIGANDFELHLSFTTQQVRGRVAIGGKPLQSTLEFSNSRGRTATTASDDDGRFELLLPDRETKEWEVLVKSEQPPIERTLVGVRTGESNDIRIDLPDTTLRGEVLDEQGKPVPYPIIRILGLEGRSLPQPIGTEAGTFAIAGLPPGTVKLQAVGGDNLESDPITVQISESGDSAPVTIVVKRQKEVRGIVVSDFGPVAGAEITVIATDVPQSMTFVRRSDARGRFTAFLPAHAREFDIIVKSLGFAYTIDHVHYRDSTLQVHVDHAGGTLVVNGRGGARNGVQILHGGAIRPARVIANETNGTASETEAVLPRLEPGPYSACIVEPELWPVFRASAGMQGGRCVSGVLPPNGRLTLDVSKLEQSTVR